VKVAEPARPVAPQEPAVVLESPAPPKKDDSASSDASKGEPTKKPPVKKKTK
jgi:hypothetical protein